jgi:hypothetical protein
MSLKIIILFTGFGGLSMEARAVWVLQMRGTGGGVMVTKKGESNLIYKSIFGFDANLSCGYVIATGYHS